MMNNSEIEHIIKIRFQKINTGLECVRQHFNENDIRVFRVKLKKLAAFLRLMDGAKDKHRTLKTPRRALHYFEVLGIVRKFQMQQIRIEKALDEKQLVLAEIYVKLISDNILHNTSAASQMIRGVQPLKKAEGKLLKLVPDQLSQKTKERFVRSELTKLEKLLAPVFPADKLLHKTRKLLKGLLYVWPYIQEEVNQLSPYHLLSNEENISAFTIVLGKFHDINGAIELLHSGCSAKWSAPEEKTVLRAMESLWIKEKEASRQEIYQHLVQIIKSRKLTQPTLDSAVM